MTKEIERKFLIKDKEIIKTAKVWDTIKQGYLTSAEECNTVRVRILNGVLGLLTVKGPTTNITRAEIEFPILIHEARMLMQLCTDIIEKVRYEIKVDDHVFYIDKFTGLNQGLFVAEIELPDELAEFPKPEWLGREVSYDTRYYNSNLSTVPFSHWELTLLETHRRGEQ